MARLCIALLFAIGLLAGAAHLAWAEFDPDEFQHAHIAWLIAQGEVPYRDFWEHHGPLFGLLNGALLSLGSAKPGIDLLFWCRGLSALSTLSIALFTALIAREAGLGRAASLGAAALFLSLYVVQDKGVECRPDSVQNALWFAGLWLMLVSGGGRRAALLPVAGALAGLAVLSNAKTGVAALGVLAFYGVKRLHGWPRHRAATDLGLLVIGGLLAYAAVLAWFAAHGAVAQLHFFNLDWNLVAVGVEGDGTTRSLQYMASMVKRQLPLVLAAATGAYLWGRELARIRAGNALRPDAPHLERARAGLLMLVALATAAGLYFNLYSQFLLLLLPPWCVIAAFGAQELAARAEADTGTRARTGLAILAGLAVLTLALQAVRFAPAGERPMLRTQKAFTARMLADTPRAEPLGVLWNDCGGYMFNANLQFFWVADAPWGRTATLLFGADPFAEPFIAALEEKRVRHIVGDDGEVFRRLPEVTQRHLRDHFDYSDCLWSRR